MQNKIDYRSIVKKAINITVSNKILWWFGFLAIFSGSYLSFNYTFPSNSSEKKMDEMEFMNMMRKISFCWESYREWIILGIIFLIVVLIGFFVLGLIGRGALIDSIFKIIKDETFSFSSGIKRGIHFLGRLFLINLFFSLAFLILIFILAFPVIRLFIFKSYLIASSLGLVAVVLLVSIFILFFYLKRYAELYLISSDLSVLNSIKLAYKLFEKNIKESFIVSLILIALNIIIGIILTLITLGLFVPGGILGVIAYTTMGELTAIVFIIMATLFFVGLIVFVRSILNVFFESIWVLFFYEIANKKEDPNNLLEREKNINLNREAESGITV